jgi:hypothetical protein
MNYRISPGLCTICGKGRNQFINHSRCSKILQQKFGKANENPRSNERRKESKQIAAELIGAKTP